MSCESKLFTCVSRLILKQHDSIQTWNCCKRRCRVGHHGRDCSKSEHSAGAWWCGTEIGITLAPRIENAIASQSQSQGAEDTDSGVVMSRSTLESTIHRCKVSQSVFLIMLRSHELTSSQIRRNKGARRLTWIHCEFVCPTSSPIRLKQDQILSLSG